MSVLPWPASSPDLNPIENLWGWMDYQLHKTRITSLEMLKEELHALWLKVPEKMVQNHVDLFTVTMQEVVILSIISTDFASALKLIITFLYFFFT
jgi:hypothetical protein